MSSDSLETDYLVIGAGAMGMAFTDVLMTETDATVVMVDRAHRPGGHWNIAYPFVRLHQPSSFYGVNSLPLGSDTIDQTGLNKGLYELASSAEVCAYFEQVMQRQFLPSGRVRFFPMSEYQGERRFSSRVSGRTHEVVVRKKIVDATYMHVTVPAMRAPEYEVASGVRCAPPNDLVRLRGPHSGYVIVGAGKTAMDACLWLLQNEVDPDAITWIMPRDSWLLDRAGIQPGLVGRTLPPGDPADADSIDELFEILERSGQLLRLDRNVRPTMYRCATVTLAELEQLRRIDDVVRMGRVSRIDETEIVLEHGTIPTDSNRLHVDCTADGLERRPIVPVFDGENITLQSVRTCQQVFSAAFIAHVEAAYEDEDRKNALCTVVPHPDTDLDWLRTTLTARRNQLIWAEDEELQTWLANSRLDPFTQPLGAQVPNSREAREAASKLIERAARGFEKIEALFAGAQTSPD